MLTYEKKGSGPAIVFIHGFLSGPASFDGIVEDLVATNTVIVVALPGIGKSNVEKDTYTIEDYAKEITEVLLQEGIEEAIWAGHSMGGYIALAAADEKIAKVSRLILLFSSDQADSEEAKEKREKQKGEIKEQGVDAFVDSLMGNFFPDKTPQKTIDKMKKIAKDATPEGMIHQLTAMQGRKNRSEFIQTTKIPISIIEGLLDQIVAPIETDGPAVQKIRIPTGHMGIVEKPALLVDAIRMALID